MSVPCVEIQSTSSESVSTIQITYEEGTDLDIAATKLREKFDMVSLPEDAADPMIININASELMPTAMIALMGEDLSQLQTLAEDEIAPRPGAHRRSGTGIRRRRKRATDRRGD